uniref:Uncharacterized protein n=1 Tax=Zea mays TaxID=4577 RepID=A0A804PVP1_MAIZE
MRGERSKPAACSRSRRPVTTPLKPTALGTKAAMRKGAALGAGPVPDWRSSPDLRLPGATLVPAPLRRAGLRTCGGRRCFGGRGWGWGPWRRGPLRVLVGAVVGQRGI